MDTTTACSAWVLLIFGWLAVLGWLGDKLEARRHAKRQGVLCVSEARERGRGDA